MVDTDLIKAQIKLMEQQYLTLQAQLEVQKEQMLVKKKALIVQLPAETTINEVVQ